MSNTVESLPANWYYDEAVFRSEQKNIFEKNWTFIVDSTEVAQPGRFVTATIANQFIIIVRTLKGELKGFLNLCRHRASTICAEDNGSLTQFTCPYHAWSYDLDGRLKNAPGFKIGEQVTSEKFSLIPVQVDIWNGLVFACLHRECASLESWLGDIVRIAENYPAISEMTFATTRRDEGRINWKNYSDNAAEGYHLPTIHPALNAALVSKQTRIAAYENGKFIGFKVVYKDRDNDSEDSSQNDCSGFWIYKFPGLLLHFSMNSFNIERVIPIDPQTTVMQRWFWFKPSIDKQQRKQAIEFSSQVMKEDIGICTRVQKNLEGGVYQTGLLSRQREPGTIFFQQCVKEALPES
ncbi:aromatic ring-hydroxylating oxygenase subunit alpha [Candidatus Spongiihabitans sp.]|uniref:aromatic ring-hydroxylating oxygenase subunit alpha n=1 Tax=Candidatus Spongiihabitans sp. TaxID=3101308 RepID=UPI003C7C2104